MLFHALVYEIAGDVELWRSTKETMCTAASLKITTVAPWVLWNDDDIVLSVPNSPSPEFRQVDLAWLKVYLRRWLGSDSSTWNNALEECGWTDPHRGLSEGDITERDRIIGEFRKAQQLCQEEKLQEAFLIYGRFHQQAMETQRRRVDRYHSFPPFLHFTLKQITKLYNEIYPEILGIVSHERSVVDAFLVEVVEREIETKSADKLCILRDLLGYALPEIPERGQQLGIRMLRRLQTIFGPSHCETLPAIKYLAESYIYDGYKLDVDRRYRFAPLSSSESPVGDYAEPDQHTANMHISVVSSGSSEGKYSESEAYVSWQEEESSGRQRLENIETSPRLSGFSEGDDFECEAWKRKNSINRERLENVDASFTLPNSPEPNDGKSAIHVSWEERQSIINQHLEYMEADSSATDEHILHYRFVFGLELLKNERIAEAQAIVKETFHKRQQVYKDCHDKLKWFMEELFEAYCSEQVGSEVDHEFRSAWKTGAFINDLVEFCLEQERYSELEILTQECSFPKIETRRETEDETLGIWYQSTSAQALLAKHKTPGGSYYWEDSRMYFRTWDQVTLVHARPPDPVPKAPAAVIVTETHIIPAISPICLEDFQSQKGSAGKSLADIWKMLEETELWHLLDSKRQSGDWSVLLDMNEGGSGWFHRHVEKLSKKARMHLFWIFLDEHLEPSPDGLDCQFVKLPIPNKREYTLESSWVAIAFYRKDKRRRFYSEDDSHRCHSEGYGQPETMQYRLVETRSKAVHMTIPFVPYQHFQKSRAYRNGFTYREYIQIMTWIAHRDNGNILDLKKRLCFTKPRETKELPAYHLPTRAHHLGSPQHTNELDNTQASGPVQGFCNGIPADAILDHNNDTGGLNFVSSDWVDWKNVKLHMTTPESIPELTLPIGEAIQCHGYIYGTWTQGHDINCQWKGLRFYVVDCNFGHEMTDQRAYFLINPRNLGSRNIKLLSGPEKRFFCGALNPFLFRHAYPPFITLGSRWKRFKGKKKKDSEDDLYWEEMNRRENWDKSFDQRINKCMDGLSHDASQQQTLIHLEREKMEEYQARSEWDANLGT